MSKQNNDAMVRDAQARAAQQAKAQAKKAKRNVEEPRNRIRDTFSAKANLGKLAESNQLRWPIHSEDRVKELYSEDCAPAAAVSMSQRRFIVVAWDGDRANPERQIVNLRGDAEQVFRKNWISKFSWALKAKFKEIISFNAWPDGVELDSEGVKVYAMRIE